MHFINPKGTLNEVFLRKSTRWIGFYVRNALLVIFLRPNGVAALQASRCFQDKKPDTRGPAHYVPRYPCCLNAQYDHFRATSNPRESNPIQPVRNPQVITSGSVRPINVAMLQIS